MAGGSPTVSRTTKSSSPPAGTPSMMTFEIAMCAAVNALSASACSRLGGLDRLGQSLGLLEKRRPILLGRRADLLARGLLLGAQIVGSRDGGPTVRVGRQQCVDEGGILAAGTL